MVARGEAKPKASGTPGSYAKINEAPEGRRKPSPQVSVAPPGLCIFVDAYQGLRSLCSLTPGYHPTPHPGLKPKDRRPEPLLALIFCLHCLLMTDY
jgi:hypothetical protein